MKASICQLAALTMGSWLVMCGHSSGQNVPPTTNPMQAFPTQTFPPPLPPSPTTGPPVTLGQPTLSAPVLYDTRQGKDCFRVTLDDGSLIVGTIAAETHVLLQSKIGEVKIAMTQIAQIRPARNEGQFEVTLTNHDRLTGPIEFRNATLKTSWGEISLDVKGLVKIDAGKLCKENTICMLRSPDGKVVAIPRKRGRFHSMIPTVRLGYPTTASSYYPATASPPYAPEAPVRAVPALAPVFAVPSPSTMPPRTAFPRLGDER